MNEDFNQPPPSLFQRLGGGPIVAIVGAIGLTFIVVMTFANSSGNKTSHSDRWSGFPRTLSCEILPLTGVSSQGATFSQLPDSLKLTQIRLAHPGENKLELSLDFADGPPPVPQTVMSNGRVADAPGSINYTVDLVPAENDNFDVPALSLSSPSRGKSWEADVTTLDIPDQNTLLGSFTIGNTVKLSVDLDGQDMLLGDGPFRPEVTVSGFQTLPGVSPLVIFEAQRCE